MLFFAESPNTPWPSEPGEYTAFAASIASKPSIDLTMAPFDKDEAGWTHPTQYTATQDLADAARSALIEIIRYRSVRDIESGHNVALLTCRAFARPRPVGRQTWPIRLCPSGVQAVCPFPEMRIGFDRSDFAGDPRIAALDWNR